jgi:ribulose-bisphosphate carboxylase large chain
MGDREKRVAEIVNINNFLSMKFYNLKTTFPVASGGIHPSIVPLNIRNLGKNIVIQAGGGIHGHPMGTRTGATAMRQAIDAAIKGIPLEKYAENHEELKLAIQKWRLKFAEEE